MVKARAKVSDGSGRTIRQVIVDIPSGVRACATASGVVKCTPCEVEDGLWERIEPLPDALTQHPAAAGWGEGLRAMRGDRRRPREGMRKLSCGDALVCGKQM
jgi:hypothetical protein